MRYFEIINISDSEKEKIKNLEESIIQEKDEFMHEYFVNYNLYEKFEDPDLENFVNNYRTGSEKPKFAISILFYITKQGKTLEINLNRKVEKTGFDGKRVATLFFDTKKDLSDFMSQFILKFSVGYKVKNNIDFTTLKENTTRLLRTDNPGGSWLEKQQERAAKSLRFAEGSQTANYGLSGPKIEIKVDYIKDLRGVNGEHKFRHSSSKYDDIMASVKEIGWDPKYAIMIWVDYQGIAKIAEGNHRTAVAADLGIEWIPAEIHYYAGGEEVPGRFSPSTLEGKGIIRVRN